MNGRFVPTAGAGSTTTLDPSTGAVIAKVPAAPASLVDDAVKAARQALDCGGWAAASAEERRYLLHLLADAVEDNAELLAELETRDTGFPLAYTRGGHIARAVEALRFFAGEAERLAGEAFVSHGAYLSSVLRIPVGVVALLTPWSAPLTVTAMNLAAVLACGNTCVLKPGEQAPLVPAALMEIISRLDFPPGAVNLVHG
ncbi:MAG: aldehyde dehydrogenase family protein, partial [Actinomycetota bacterium]|nr:aldehyde dehydrogenase family protein [Actinomycetota bacterium]